MDSDGAACPKTLLFELRDPINLPHPIYARIPFNAENAKVAETAEADIRVY